MKSGDTKAGGIDGFSAWSPVDAILADESRYGIRGLAGNVSEWTGSWDADPDSPDKKVPITRGAAFNTREGFEVTTRRAAASADDRNFWTGFRIASDRQTFDAMTPDPAAAPPAEAPEAAPAMEETEASAESPAEPAPEPAAAPAPAEKDMSEQDVDDLFK